jgi:uncharacterized membrane protein YbhN (UPF0104 family)
MSFLGSLVTYAPVIISVASAASSVLPAPKPGSVGSVLVALVNVLALNVGHAANATPASLKTEAGNTSLANTIK